MLVVTKNKVKAVELGKKVFEAGNGSIDDLADLIQHIFICTVFQQNSFVTKTRITNEEDVWIIGGIKPFGLRDGKYLKFFMKCKCVSGKPPSVEKACVQYQLDEDYMSNLFIFRYDYDIDPPDKHPISHLQISGTFNYSEHEMKKIQFPVNRPSLESIIRLLIEKFHVPSRDRNWQEVLAITERRFKKHHARRVLDSFT